MKVIFLIQNFYIMSPILHILIQVQQSFINMKVWHDENRM